eukprot:1139297-Pelagomonas_calceolata.AAC.1
MSTSGLGDRQSFCKHKDKEEEEEEEEENHGVHYSQGGITASIRQALLKLNQRTSLGTFGPRVATANDKVYMSKFCT